MAGIQPAVHFAQCFRQVGLAQVFGGQLLVVQREHVVQRRDARAGEHVAAGQIGLVDMTAAREVLWFINGRNAPDTFSAAGAPWL